MNISNENLTTFRKETRAFLEANCPESMRQPVAGPEDSYWGGRNATFASDDQRHWFEAMLERNWTVPHWPKVYGGGGLGKAEYKILKEEMARLNCRLPLTSFGVSMLGPALLKFGTEAQKMEHLPKIAAGQIRWCQGYSEPNAGSDLASLQTQAIDQGDHFLVTGQKVWTSYADKCDWIFCLVRTNNSAKHQHGISFVLMDMESEGMSTRPIKLISGKSPFCETFMDNVKAYKSNLIGELNQGWTIAKYLLTHEREMIGSLFGGISPVTFQKEIVAEIGVENGVLNDTVLRTDVADWSIDAAAFALTLERVMDEAKAGHSLGAVSSTLKYYGTELNKSRLELLLAAGGADALAWEGEASKEGKIAKDFCRTKGNSIEGGTSEIQLNIIAKHILRLPSR